MSKLMANSADPDQTAPLEVAWFGSTLFLPKLGSLMIEER